MPPFQVDADIQRLGLAKQPFWQLFWTGCKLYATHWKSFTRPLLMPILKITLGAYACIILNYLFINGLSEGARLFFQQNLWMLMLVMLLIAAGTLFWFFQGFWEYLVYVVSFNINATEVLQDEPLQIKTAYDALLSKAIPYRNLLAFYCLLPCIAAAPFILLSFISALLPAPLNVLVSLTGLLLSTAAGVIWLILLVFLTFIFQIVALEDDSNIISNPVEICLRSIRLVWKRWWDTLALQVALMVITAYLVPIPVIFVLRLLRLSWLLDAAHLWVVQLVLSGANPQVGAEPFPYYSTVFQQFQMHSVDLAQFLTDSVLSGILTGLLLPLGAIIFTLLYWVCVTISSHDRVPTEP